MPINILYCEGNSKSIDVRAIRQLLPKNCTVYPIGGKRKFMDSIIADRAIDPNLAGLADRDFDCCDIILSNNPCHLFHQNVQVGWTWERKEIENYLIDPQVVRRALRGKSTEIQMEEYQVALSKAAENISTYTDARTALSCYGFKNCWGEQVSNTSSYFFPKRLGKEACEQNIRQIVQENKGDRIVKPEDVLNKFERLLPLFRAGGVRFDNFLTFFAGKDLLYTMRDSLSKFGFESSQPQISPQDVFLERVIKGMEKAEEVWTWLPEWQELRKLIINTTF